MVKSRKLSAKARGTIGAMTKNPDGVVNPETGQWRQGAAKKLNVIANGLLGIHRGRSADGCLRESTPNEERVVSDEYLDHISCDPLALAAQSRHRPARKKTLRLTQTGQVTAEEKLTKRQQRWLEALQGNDPDARAKAEAEVKAWMLEKHEEEQADIDASLAEMGYAEDSVPRAQLDYPESDDKWKFGIFPLDDDDDPALDYLSIDLNPESDDD